MLVNLSDVCIVWPPRANRKASAKTSGPSRQFAIVIGQRTTLEARSFYVAFPPALLHDS